MRLGVFSFIQTIAKMVSPKEKAAFVDLAVSKIENVMDNAYPSQKRNFCNIKTVKNQSQTSSLQPLQTDKSCRFAILSESSFQMRTETAMNSLFMNGGVTWEK